MMRDVVPAEIPERLFRDVPHAPGNPRKREAGLSMLSLVLSRGNHPPLENSLFVVYDPDVAVRMQLLIDGDDQAGDGEATSALRRCDDYPAQGFLIEQPPRPPRTA